MVNAFGNLKQQKTFKPEQKNKLSGNEMVLTRARPRHVSVSTKYVTADLDYSNSGTLSITVAVEGRCCPAICLCAPTPHKPAAG